MIAWVWEHQTSDTKKSEICKVAFTNPFGTKVEHIECTRKSLLLKNTELCKYRCSRIPNPCHKWICPPPKKGAHHDMHLVSLLPEFLCAKQRCCNLLNDLRWCTAIARPWNLCWCAAVYTVHDEDPMMGIFYLLETKESLEDSIKNSGIPSNLPSCFVFCLFHHEWRWSCNPQYCWSLFWCYYQGWTCCSPA